MASSKEIRISIVSALNAAGIEATKQQIKDMTKSVKESMAEASSSNRTHWADIKAAWDMGCAAIGKAVDIIKTALASAFNFETQTRQFKTLIGNIDEAKQHMQDLKELGDTPPFSLDEFAKASRSMLVMTDGVLGYKKSLELIGDAAAATGQPIENLAREVGRAYGIIRDGQPIKEAVTGLRNMGAITPEVAKKLQDLQNEGKSTTEIWGELEKALGRYNGAMAETEKTGAGLMGAIESRWDNIVRAFGMAFADTAAGGMQNVLDKMKEIEEDGTLEEWADNVGESVSKVATSIKYITGLFDGLWKIVKSTVGVAMAFGAGADDALANGEGFFDQIKAGGRVAKQYWNDTWSDGNENNNELAQIRRDAAKHRKAEEEEEKKKSIKREEAERTKMQENLAAGQKKIDERLAKEREEAAKKAADKAAARASAKAAKDDGETEKEAGDGIADKMLEASVMSPVARGREVAIGGGGGGGGGGSTGDSSYDAQVAELDRQYNVLMTKRNLYRQKKFRERSESTAFARKNIKPFGLSGFYNPYDDWSGAADDANEKFGAAIEEIRARRRQLDESFSMTASAGGDSQERTARACEGILKHFENGRAA